MPSQDDQQTIRRHAEQQRSKLRQAISSEDLEELLQTAFDICDESGPEKGLAIALEWLTDLFMTYSEVELWSARVAVSNAVSKIEATCREASLRVGAILAGRDAARKAQNRHFPDSGAIDRQTRPPLGTILASWKLEEELENFHRRYPNLNLTMKEYRHVNSVQRCLSGPQLQTLNEMLQGYPVMQWQVISLVTTGPAMYCLMPYRVRNFDLCLGPEITRDWIGQREGHGFPIRRIADAWKAIKEHPTLTDPVQGEKGYYRYDLNRKRLVTDAAKKVLITYYDTGYGV